MRMTQGDSTEWGKPVGSGAFWKIPVRSSLQRNPTEIRFLLPSSMDVSAVVFVLPVEAECGVKFGDGLREVANTGFADRHQVAFCAPTFSDSPWGVNHFADPRRQQESYLVDFVASVVGSLFGREIPRFTLGFSKGGFSALNMLLRHRDVFSGASIWDGSMLRERPTPAQLLEVAGNEAQVAKYSVPAAIRTSAYWMKDELLLALGGYGILRDDQRAAHASLNSLGVKHLYYDGPMRQHRWDSGWVPGALEVLRGLSTWPR